MKKTLVAVLLAAAATAPALAYTVSSSEDGKSYVRASGYLRPQVNFDRSLDETTLDRANKARLSLRSEFTLNGKLNDENTATGYARLQKSLYFPYTQRTTEFTLVNKVKDDANSPLVRQYSDTKYNKKPKRLTSNVAVDRYYVGLNNSKVGSFSYGKEYTVAALTNDGLFTQYYGAGSAMTNTQVIFDHTFKYSTAPDALPFDLTYTYGTDKGTTGYSYTYQHGAVVNKSVNGYDLLAAVTYQKTNEEKTGTYYPDVKYGVPTQKVVYSELSTTTSAGPFSLGLELNNEYSFDYAKAGSEAKQSNVTYLVGYLQYNTFPKFKPYLNLAVGFGKEVVYKAKHETSKETAFGVDVGFKATLFQKDSFSVTYVTDFSYSRVKSTNVKYETTTVDGKETTKEVKTNPTGYGRNAVAYLSFNY